VSAPVGNCPKNAAGHEWEKWMVDPRKSCVHCGRPGRDDHQAGERGGYYAEATMARMELFDGLRTPLSSHGKAPRS
jgi:hypothetical protein